MNPLDKGDFTGLEMEEIKEVDTEWYAQLQKDPFQTRFPGGESYKDLIQVRVYEDGAKTTKSKVTSFEAPPTNVLLTLSNIMNRPPPLSIFSSLCPSYSASSPA